MTPDEAMVAVQRIVADHDATIGPATPTNIVRNVLIAVAFERLAVIETMLEAILDRLDSGEKR